MGRMTRYRYRLLARVLRSILAVNDHAGQRVLIVEDDRDIREALCMLLEEEGYSVYSAENGAVATLLLAGQPPPSLVLTDLMMPVMNGWELIEMLRHDDALSGVPVVVISATADGRLPDGVRELLQKPASASAILEAVEHHAAS